MNYKDKLVDLLKIDELVKSEIWKLEFWTKIILKDYFDKKTINQLIDYYCNEFKVCGLDKIFTQKDIEKIIWLPLQERFIRTYWKRNNPKNSKYIDVSEIVDLDDTKDFDNQEDKVYEEIYNALNLFKT